MRIFIVRLRGVRCRLINLRNEAFKIGLSNKLVVIRNLLPITLLSMNVTPRMMGFIFKNRIHLDRGDVGNFGYFVCVSLVSGLFCNLRLFRVWVDFEIYAAGVIFCLCARLVS